MVDKLTDFEKPIAPDRIVVVVHVQDRYQYVPAKGVRRYLRRTAVHLGTEVAVVVH